MYSASGMAKISASLKASRDFDFQLLASLGSFLTGAKGAATAATGALGMKLALAAVEATAGGREGTVIWAKRAEGRVARISWSGAEGAAAAVTAVGATGAVDVAAFLTVIGFASGTEAAFLEVGAGAAFALEAAAGLDTTGAGFLQRLALWLCFLFCRLRRRALAAVLPLPPGVTVVLAAGLATALTGADFFTGAAFFSATGFLAGTAFFTGTAFLAGVAFLTGTAF